MVQQESDLRNDLRGKITFLYEKVRGLSKELSVPVYQPDDGLTILQHHKELKRRLETLTKQKHTRMVALKRLLDQEKSLCDRTKIALYLISHSTVPTDDQLCEFEKHIETLKIHQAKRFDTFLIIREQIQDTLKEIDADPPATVFEIQALVENEGNFSLSAENMSALSELQVEVTERKINAEAKLLSMRKRLNVLWNRLETPEDIRIEYLADKMSLKKEIFTALTEEITRLEVLKHTHMEKVIMSMKRELERWWMVCFTPQELRDKCTAFCTEGIFTDEIADALEAEIGHLQSFYERHQNLYSQVKQWEELLEEFAVLERKATDPNRYNNRGGALLQEEKTRKRIEKELPKVESNLRELIGKWEAEQQLKFSIYGIAFTEYAVQRRQYNKDEKEREKEQRQKSKALQMEADMKYGTKLIITPKKRGRLPVTPSMLVTNKTRRLNTGARTPLSVTRVNNTNNFTTKSMPRRRSNRLRPWNKNVDRTNQMLHRTIKGGIQKDSSLASTGSYNDFAKVLNSVERTNCRSSIMDHNQSPFIPARSKLATITSHTPAKSKLMGAPRTPHAAPHTPMSTRL